MSEEVAPTDSPKLEADQPIISPLSDADIPLELEDDFDDESSNDDGVIEKYEAIKRRCDDAKLTSELILDSSFPRIRVHLPAGRETRTLVVTSASSADALLARSFESICFVGDYEAICSYAEGYIEAAVGTLGSLGSMRLRELVGIKSLSRADREKTYVIGIKPPPDHPNIIVELSVGSDRLFPFASRSSSPSRPNLSIRNVELATNERAIHLLEMIANSLFFEIDLRFNIPLGLIRYRRFVGVGTGRINSRESLEERPLLFPSTTYDRSALSLYWYGRSAAGLPLLRFLAFYQSIEFYFPTYSQNEAINQAKKILKDPRFSVHDDGDVTRLVSRIGGGRAGVLGDERSQLRSVINSCVDAVALRDFLTDAALKIFYTDPKHPWKQVSKVKIPLNDVEADLRASIAERLYDIRCRIVHAKSEGGQAKSEVLLPFSREAEMLSEDTRVIQFISTQTLIASSSKLAL
jgi:hypothetical protein